MKQYIILSAFVFVYGQNEVCFEVEPNPTPNNPALSSFTKFVNVLDCFKIYGESQISDDKMLHAASVSAELLDNDENGLHKH